MKTGFLCGIFAVLFLLTPACAWALHETGTDAPVDAAFVGDTSDKADEIEILEPKDIQLLTDQKLEEAYIDAIVEIEASKTFHSTSGFTPKEFKKYKRLLKYRLQLLLELHRRNLQVPAAS